MRRANPRLFIPLLAVIAFLVVAGATLPIFRTEAPASVDVTEGGSKKGRGRGVTQKRGAGHVFAKEPLGAKRQSIFEKWKASRAQREAAARNAAVAKRVADPRVPIGPGSVGRNSVVINDANQILFSKHFPGTPCDPDPQHNAAGLNLPFWQPNTAYAVGALVRSNTPGGMNSQATVAGTSAAAEPAWPPTVGSTFGDGTVTWQRIAFAPGQFTGCQPMQLVIRDFSGAQSVIVTEGQTLPDGSQVAGWGEFYDMNDNGVAAFKTAIVGPPWSPEGGFGGGADETGVALFTAPPLTEIARNGTVVGTRTLCGFGPMMQINNAGQIVYEGMFLDGAGNCETDDSKGVFRFTPGPGNEFLFGIGTNVGGGVTVTQWGDFGDGDYFGGLSSAGATVASVQLSDGDQAVYLLTGPGAFTEVARSGNAGPGGIYDSFGAQVFINNSNEILFKASIGGDGSPSTGDDGVDGLRLFVPGSGVQTIVQIGTAVPGGGSYQGFAPFMGINNNGDVVFRAGLNGALPGVEDDEQAGIFVWTRSSGLFSEVQRVGAGNFGLFTDTLAINDARAVAFGVKTPGDPPAFDDPEEQEQNIRMWTPTGGVTTIVQVGDNLDGAILTSVFAQHIPFARQFNATCGFATAAYANNDPPDEAPEATKNGRLFAVFNVPCGGPTPTPTFTTTPTFTITAGGPTFTATSTRTPTNTRTPSNTPVPGGQPTDIPTLHGPMLALLAVALLAIALYFVRRP